eukprot:CAMPEP_0169085878 /NCGR_PEP_ID=MMETSP1015-20121227/13398_1 /TAXON_ID=342587 /ORGANISM="Karlodinium micrum, Strain CCMP2283" /LENGTH=99 /DNA_ID=CAMNT_0009146001 /DNA_START=363 /DNA_END=662 /DNA_ORIENTATION=+
MRPGWLIRARACRLEGVPTSDEAFGEVVAARPRAISTSFVSEARREACSVVQPEILWNSAGHELLRDTAEQGSQSWPTSKALIMPRRVTTSTRASGVCG